MESLIDALLWLSNQPDVLNILSTATLVGEMVFFVFGIVEERLATAVPSVSSSQLYQVVFNQKNGF